MQSIKKTLLIFFGELRTFEYVIPHLKDLDKVDIVLSTWNESTRFDTKFLVDDKLIYEIIPNIKQHHIVNPDSIPNFHFKWNSWKMYWHWKNAINNVENLEQYENVILHRTDLISNWETILDTYIESDTIYCHHGDLINPYFKKGIYGLKNESVWINDYYFFGKFDIMKKFVNSFDKNNYPTPHIGIWETLSTNNFQFKQFILKAKLIRDLNIEEIEYLNLNNISIKLNFLSGPC
jgi:hypothetical protein